MKSVKERFWDKVQCEPNSGCWIWVGNRNERGYGCMKVRGRQMKAHRVSWMAYRGKIPDGLQIDHLCRVRLCVNPDHMEVVTCKENIRRGNTGKRLGVVYEVRPRLSAEETKERRREQSRDRMRVYMQKYRTDHPEQMRETRARYEAKQRGLS